MKTQAMTAALRLLTDSQCRDCPAPITADEALCPSCEDAAWDEERQTEEDARLSYGRSETTTMYYRVQ